MQPKKIGIIGGMGKVGSSLRTFFVNKDCDVIYSDTSTVDTNELVVASSDVVIFAVSLGAMVEVIEKVTPFSKSRQLWIDVASKKKGVIEAMLKSKAEVASIHPLFAPTNRSTWKGETVAFSPVRLSQWSDWMDSFLEATEARVEKIKLEEHDELMLCEQNIPHLGTFVQAMLIADHEIDPNSEKLLKFSTRFSRRQLGLIARLLKQDPALVADIQMSDRGAELAMIDEFIGVLTHVRGLVSSADKETFISDLQSLRAHFGESFIASASKFFD